MKKKKSQIYTLIGRLDLIHQRTCVSALLQHLKNILSICSCFSVRYVQWKTHTPYKHTFARETIIQTPFRSALFLSIHTAIILWMLEQCNEWASNSNDNKITATRRSKSTTGSSSRGSSTRSRSSRHREDEAQRAAREASAHTEHMCMYQNQHGGRVWDLKLTARVSTTFYIVLHINLSAQLNGTQWMDWHSAQNRLTRMTMATAANEIRIIASSRAMISMAVGRKKNDQFTPDIRFVSQIAMHNDHCQRCTRERKSSVHLHLLCLSHSDKQNQLQPIKTYSCSNQGFEQETYLQSHRGDRYYFIVIFIFGQMIFHFRWKMIICRSCFLC